jgi:hypothetical protein
MKLKKLYKDNRISDEEYNIAESLLNEFSKSLEGRDIDDISAKELDEYIEKLLGKGQCDEISFVQLMRYFLMVKRNDLYIHLTRYTGTSGVIESMLSSVKEYSVIEKWKTISNKTNIPPLGTHPDKLPSFAFGFVNLLKELLDDETVINILAGNHHGISEEAFDPEKVYYEKAKTLDEYLLDLHKRKIEELRHYYETGKVWYEQIITESVLEFVSKNQEILSAVRDGDRLLITKIPYDTGAFLNAKTPFEKAYHVCHCPFVREAIRKGDELTSDTWCYCSGGFTKYPFDVLFGENLKVELVSSALRGELCRFSISLDKVEYKK